ncbi:MAG: AmmeMemoRadiSam system radical SAM enzyme [Proteobacteria bacterium]|nr:AmmeMemoRadiSam system radical SAM enzyme [Pseudomonadota bacterium]
MTKDRIEGHPTHYWHTLDDGRVQCDVCPRLCKMREGQRGLCFVRGVAGGAVVLTTYGRSSGFCIDPIEKKPLNHFLPGTPVLSFGTAGCNLTCKFCQNWDISKSREFDKLQDKATPEAIADAAVRTGCKSVAVTYNDPVIFMEYAIDVAQACREKGIKMVAVTAGYMCDEPRTEFYKYMDAANVDLKAFTESFYKNICTGSLAPVLETLKYLKHETDVWFEITDLLIPGENDGEAEIEEMTGWVMENLGPDVPMHFSAFHPDWKMTDKPNTPLETVVRARRIAMKNGIRYAYTGNVHDPEGDATLCHQCGEVLIGRDWYDITAWALKTEGNYTGNCGNCGTPVAGIFDGPPGDWGRKRLPVRIGS